jgi:hypothetical protein
MRIYIEGGGNSKDLRTRCREGFRRLLEKCGFTGRMPRLVACGGRGATFDDFSTAHSHSLPGDYVAMLLDSEDPVAELEHTWAHLKLRDQWDRPSGADDEQVLLMTTCMETWIACDRQTLQRHYREELQERALPELTDLESRAREAIQDALARSTRNCPNRYAKGQRPFDVVGKLDPAVLRGHLPSFARCERVLRERL